ncbi:hypothetical protein OUQ92_000410, partial [Loigolactobacillus backii]|nr:hypothetical protein [Loigolactobacillus backii]MDA5390208.1 hypothetical protein [Loigolactobacillus backii]
SISRSRFAFFKRSIIYCLQNKALVKAINNDLKKLKANGYLEKITKKYLYEDTFKLANANKTFNSEAHK